MVNTDGNPLSDVAFYAEQAPLGIYLTDKNTVHFTWADVVKDSIQPDSLFRVDMDFYNGLSVPPVAYGQTPDLANYYLGAFEATNVKAFHRVKYSSVWNGIDVHFHHGSTGPRMSFIVRPGASPGAIGLRFNGQDSLHVDWAGRLKIWLDNKWIEFQEAVAYQVGDTGNIMPVNWTANYELVDGSPVVKFSFDTYDTERPLLIQIGYPPLPAMGGTSDNMEWSTYVGGNGGDELESVAVDENGDAYTCGSSWSNDFPVDPGSNVFTPFIGDPPGTCSAVIMKFQAGDKRLVWATYYGGSVDDTWQPKTKAAKLAVYTGEDNSLSYVFATGSTSCQDFSVFRRAESPFIDAHMQAFDGGTARMWVGAFTKFDGTRDWATTQGETGGDRTWGQHGLAIDVDEEGRLAVGGMLETFSGDIEFDMVTPVDYPNALAWTTGHGYAILFDRDYSILWSSTLLTNSGYGYGRVRITDIDFGRTGLNEPGLWFTGVCATGYNTPWHAVPPPGTGYYQPYADGEHAVIGVLELNELELEYCTAWGELGEGSGSTVPNGIHNTGDGTWVVGSTECLGLTSTELPPPIPGSGAIYTTTHELGLGGQWSDAFMFRIKRGSYILEYGTLVGGKRDDIFLDVTSDEEDNVYITGETRSSIGFSVDLDASQYYQDETGNPFRRDAILLGIRGGIYPEAFWRSVFGGVESDRGWGVAASADELYLVGSTGSQITDGFPLREFDTTDEFDFFQVVNLEGDASWFVPWVDFETALDFEHTGYGENPIEPIGSPHDGFIASFDISALSVGLVNTKPRQTEQLLVRATGQPGLWLIELPEQGPWSYRVVDAAGKVVALGQQQGQQMQVDLSTNASGLYAVSVFNTTGVALHTKLVRP